MVRSTAKSTYFKELLFPFFKIFYTLIVHYVVNFVFSIGKQPYRDVINFVSYIHVVYSYNDINFTYLYMRTNYLRPLANIVNILWSRPVWRGGGSNSQLNWLTCCKRQMCSFAVADKHDSVLEVIDGQAIL